MNAIHREFDADWYTTRLECARNWVSERIIDIVAAYQTADSAGNRPANYDTVIAELNGLFNHLSNLDPPPALL